MKSAKYYIVIMLFGRLVLIFAGLALYVTSCPVVIDTWIIWVVSISAILEPLLLLLLALLVEINSSTKNHKK